MKSDYFYDTNKHNHNPAKSMTSGAAGTLQTYRITSQTPNFFQTIEPKKRKLSFQYLQSEGG